MLAHTRKTYNVAHMFCGLGAGAMGFNHGHARVGVAEAEFRCLGGIDVDGAAIRDFTKLAGVPGTQLDLFTREQYVAFHGKQPPLDWREATIDDVRAAYRNEHPHVVFLSAPCKGFSQLLSEEKSKTDRYQALNGLTLRGVWMVLEAYKDNPPELMVFENVPQIARRGRRMLDQIVALLRAYGYAVAETAHDCGRIGNLGQSRKRFLLVARHAEKVPGFLYEPVQHPLRSVGDILERFPLPGDPRGGAMHRIPSLAWKTWVRLALVEAGSDWRSLARVKVERGVAADLALMPAGKLRNGAFGVADWLDTSGAVIGESLPSNGKFAVADPRPENLTDRANYAVGAWTGSSATITSQRSPGQGRFSVADPRLDIETALSSVPNASGLREGLDVDVFRILAGQGGSGPSFDRGEGRLPAPDDRLVSIILSLDGTWHRPFTTLELAALQGMVKPEEHLELDGLNDGAWRERIGNAVPPPAAEAIASVMLRTLLMAELGETFSLSAEPIWVRNVAVGLSLAQSDADEARLGL